MLKVPDYRVYRTSHFVTETLGFEAQYTYLSDLQNMYQFETLYLKILRYENMFMQN